VHISPIKAVGVKFGRVGVNDRSFGEGADVTGQERPVGLEQVGGEQDGVVGTDRTGNCQVETVGGPRWPVDRKGSRHIYATPRGGRAAADREITRASHGAVGGKVKSPATKVQRATNGIGEYAGFCVAVAQLEGDVGDCHGAVVVEGKSLLDFGDNLL